MRTFGSVLSSAWVLAPKESPMKSYVVPILVLGLLLGAQGLAEDQPSTIITVDGERVVIARDVHGVPHLFAETNKALFTGFGYAVAEDRLWLPEPRSTELWKAVAIH
jgi:Penicillin amidase